MAPEATEGSAFGVLALTEEESLDEGLTGEETEPEAETSTETTQPPAGEPTEEPPPSEEPPGSEGEPAPEQTQYAGRFGSVEALETGYQNLEGAFTRSSQEAAELRREQQQQAQQYAEMRQLLEALAPTILQQRLAEDPELAERLRMAETIQPLVDQQVAPYRQQVEQMREQQAGEAEELQASLRVAQWRTRTGIAPNTDEDRAMAEAAKVLDLDWKDPETGHLSLDLALEASRDPDLLAVLRVNPHFIELEGGVEEARRQAAWRKTLAPANGGAPVPTPAAAAPSNGQAVRQAAYVETGGHGAPTSGAPGGTKDEFDEAIAEYNKQMESPLFR